MRYKSDVIGSFRFYGLLALAMRGRQERGGSTETNNYGRSDECLKYRHHYRILLTALSSTRSISIAETRNQRRVILKPKRQARRANLPLAWFSDYDYKIRDTGAPGRRPLTAPGILLILVCGCFQHTWFAAQSPTVSNRRLLWPMIGEAPRLVRWTERWPIFGLILLFLLFFAIFHIFS